MWPYLHNLSRVGNYISRPLLVKKKEKIYKYNNNKDPLNIIFPKLCNYNSILGFFNMCRNLTDRSKCPGFSVPFQLKRQSLTIVLRSLKLIFVYSDILYTVLLYLNELLSQCTTQDAIVVIRLKPEYVMGYDIGKYERLYLFIRYLIIRPFRKRFNDGNMMKPSVELFYCGLMGFFEWMMFLNVTCF